MIKHCRRSWVLSLATGYTDHLREVQRMLQDQLKEKEEHMAGMNFIFFLLHTLTVGFVVYFWPDIQHSFQLLENYRTAKGNFMGKAFVGDGETQIEKDLKQKYEEIDMLVSYFTLHKLGTIESLVVTCSCIGQYVLANHCKTVER